MPDDLQWSSQAIPLDAATLPGAVMPDFSGGCVASVMPALVERGTRPAPDWLPASLASAEQVVLLVVDGLGALQLAERRSLAPAMSEMERSTITTVAPSTTAAALTSLATGLTPAEHGLLGYRLGQGNAVLNVLRWRLGEHDARNKIAPESYQPHLPFFGRPVPVVSRGHFRGSGFTDAHLRGAPLFGWSVASSIPVEAGRLLRAGEPFVYAYYDGLDRIAHERGLGEHYDAEFAYVDHLVAELAAVLPPGAALAVSADHGEIEVTSRPIDLAAETGVTARLISGEGRFRWLHFAPAEVEPACAALGAHLGELAWVLTRDELIATGIFGGDLSPAYRARLGDVAVIARQAVSFLDPADRGDAGLVGRHGSLSPSEMLVPLLGCRP